MKSRLSSAGLIAGAVALAAGLVSAGVASAGESENGGPVAGPYAVQPNTPGFWGPWAGPRFPFFVAPGVSMHVGPPVPRYHHRHYPRRYVHTVDAHIEWCYGQYRSYREWDNTWKPYRGPRRQCFSPFGP